MYEFELPYPPSINHFWRRVGNRTLVSREGRQFRAHVLAILAPARLRPMSGDVCVDIALYPPDRRRRDVDNTIKPLLDSLQAGRVFEDDSQVSNLHIRRMRVIPGGKVVVVIRQASDPKATEM